MMRRMGAEAADSIVDGNQTALSLLAAGMVWRPEFPDLAHLDRGILAAAWELCPSAQQESQHDVHDHLVVAEPLDNPQDSRSRSQPAKLSHNGCSPWRGHRWHWSCVEDVVGHRGMVTEPAADWRLILGTLSLSY